ncbi:MAG: hypothetical protein KatS3mg108_1105 [Isosphaeraceae bacterium]|jgi:hypothetical protein|nr:MAG: hypothetical protein KatS3mg108_1105 [Isosphaeraceae bacterium]
MFLTALLVLTLVQAPTPGRVDPDFEAILLDGSVVRGRLTQLRLEPGGSGSLTLARDSEVAIPWNRLLRLERLGPLAPSSLVEETLLFPNGDRLLATIRRGDADSIEAIPGLAPDVPVTIPTSRLLGLMLSRPSTDRERRAIESALAAPNRDGESIWLTNGDQRAGSLTRLERDRLEVEVEGRETGFDRGTVAAIGFDPALLDPEPPPMPFLEIHLADGSRLGLIEASLEAGQVRVRTRAGLELRLPSASLFEAYPRGGSVVYLDEREPAALDFIPYLDRHPGLLGINTTWDGFPLSVRGRRYRHGLGMLPRTLVVYRIEPGDRRFQALLALDDRAGDQASVAFRVLLDRREIYASPRLTRLDDPVPIDLDLTGGRLLVLIAEFGDRGDVQDYADWLEARLIRQAPQVP